MNLYFNVNDIQHKYQVLFQVSAQVAFLVPSLVLNDVSTGLPSSTPNSVPSLKLIHFPSGVLSLSSESTSPDPSLILILVPNLESSVAHICAPNHDSSNVSSSVPSVYPLAVPNDDQSFVPCIEPSFVSNCAPSLDPTTVLSYVPEPDPSFDPIVSVLSSYPSFVDPSLVPIPVLSAVDCAHSTFTCVHHQLMRENNEVPGIV